MVWQRQQTASDQGEFARVARRSAHAVAYCSADVWRINSISEIAHLDRVNTPPKKCESIRPEKGPEMTGRAARTFIGLPADTWTAIGVWLTMFVCVILAVLAFHQLGEAQRLRREQARPLVIVDVSFRSVLMRVSVRNIGATPARDLTVTFNEKRESTMRDPDWLDSTLFTEGMPMLAPGRELLFNFDSYPARIEKGLPMVLAGCAKYSSPADRDSRQGRRRSSSGDRKNWKRSSTADRTAHAA